MGCCVVVGTAEQPCGARPPASHVSAPRASAGPGGAHQHARCSLPAWCRQNVSAPNARKYALFVSYKYLDSVVLFVVVDFCI